MPSIESFNAFFLGVPDDFLPSIGLVMVHHAHLDRELQSAICYLAGVDFNTGVSILARVTNTSARAEILQNLAMTKADNISRLAKLLVLGDVTIELSNERNIIAHQLPYGRSPAKGEIFYFNEVNKTIPQIKINPPYIATITSLNDLAARMFTAAKWLGMLKPQWKENATDPTEISHCHPHWNDDTLFPWPNRFRRRVKSESKKPQSSQRRPKDLPRPFQE